MTDREDKKARILIADDDEQIRDVLHELLSDHYECTEVSSAEEALDTIGRETFRCVRFEKAR